MNAGNASGYTKEQIKGMMGDTSSGNTGGNTSPRTKQNFLSGDNRYLSYPIARNNQEITGDTLRIKCLEYVPSNGDDFKVTVDNLFVEDVNKATGKVNTIERIPGREERKKLGLEPIKLTPTFTNADTRIRNANKRNKITKYNIELPMPQEIQDSQSVTWGDDKINALELAGVAAAGKILNQDLGATVNDARGAIAALNQGVSIPGVNSQTQNAIRAALAGAAIGVTAKKFKKWHSTFLDNLSTSIKLHKINKLIVINHRDCGAAKIVNSEKKFNSKIENKIHKDSFKKLKKVLNKKFPLLKINFKILSLKD